MIIHGARGKHVSKKLAGKTLRPHSAIEKPYKIWCSFKHEVNAEFLDPDWAQEFVLRTPLHIISPKTHNPATKNQITFIGGFRTAEFIYNRKVTVCRAIDYKDNPPDDFELFGWGELFFTLMMFPEKQRNLAEIIDLILTDLPQKVSIAYFGKKKITRTHIAKKLTVSQDRLRVRNRNSEY
ncbi:hypothetical protein [Sneathiella limimaris]|uniref:hypothetical protein n=1 Tax=Sneathiella limimaris TaxID=1964213 RepID=UPI00146BAA9F|nr:hypothetical protein [Sneathiella limimaris]